MKSTLKSKKLCTYAYNIYIHINKIIMCNLTFQISNDEDDMSIDSDMFTGNDAGIESERPAHAFRGTPTKQRSVYLWDYLT